MKYDLEHLEAFAPNSPDADRAFDLIGDAVSILDEEGEREVGLRSIPGGLLVGKRQCQVLIADRTTKPYVVWLEESLAYLTVEVKNELGSGGDPLLQGFLVYTKIFAQEKVPSPLFRSTKIPQTVPRIP